jgi:hypothetical protein
MRMASNPEQPSGDTGAQTDGFFTPGTAHEPAITSTRVQHAGLQVIQSLYTACISTPARRQRLRMETRNPEHRIRCTSGTPVPEMITSFR